MIGKTLGSYRIVGKLGEGGMGVVYSAEHPLIGRKAAVKRLLPEFSNSKEVVDRFFNEARAAAMVKHAGIVDIFDFGYADDGSAYIVMEFLEGEGLAQRLERLGALPGSEVVRLSRQAASALAAAHAAGIVHRDLKPDNIHVVPDGEVQGGERIKVLDFGIAKLNRSGGTTKTRTGAMMGSPLYMAPEQCRGAGDVDARADIYAMGCVMYHMACGRPPFDGDGVGEIIAKHIYEPPPPPRSVNPQLAPELEAVIVTCLAKEADQRFASMDALVTALDGASERRFSTEGHQPHYRTPGTGLPLQETSAPPAVSANSDTTLGASAISRTLPHDANSGGVTGRTMLVAGAAVLLLGGGAGVALIGGSDNAAGASATAGTTRAADASPASPPAIDAAPAVRTPTTVTVTLDSTPSNVSIYQPNGVRVGKTPFEQAFDLTDGELVYTLRKSGYRDLVVEIPLTADFARTVALEQARPRRSSKSKLRPKPRPTTAPVKRSDPTDKTSNDTPKWGELED